MPLDGRGAAHAKCAERYAGEGNVHKAIAHFRRALAYTGFGSEELRGLLQDGESARAAAAASRAYTLEHDGRSFSVTPSLVGGVTLVRVDLRRERYTLLVTAVYGLDGLDGIDGAATATRLDLPDEHTAKVLRLVRARGGAKGVSLFVKGDVDPEWTAAASVLVKLHELGIAAATPVVIRSKHRVFLPTRRNVSMTDDYDRPRAFGSPVHEGSDVRVGTLGELVSGSDGTPDAMIGRRHVRTLFESGEWALRQGSSGFAHVLEIDGRPETRVQLRVTMPRPLGENDPNEARPYVTVETELRMPERLKLVAVYDARWYVDQAATALETILRWDTDADAAMRLVREQAASGEMVIFAAGGNTDAWRSALRRVLRTLHGVGLTAEQKHTDALVIVREGEGTLEARRLLYLIREAGPSSLLRRESGAPKKR
jgi:hypothetical protein